MRRTPRRYFEYVINPVGSVRSFVDQWFHRMTGGPCLLPLWHDSRRMTAAAVATDTRIEFDTEYSECLVGGLAIIYADPFTFEVVEISAIDGTGIDLVSPLVGSWPERSPVYPIRRALMDADVTLSNLVSRVGQASVGLMVDGPNSYTAGAETLTVYDSHPLIVLEPNRMDALDQQYGRIMQELDGQLGRVKRYDELSRGYQTSFYNWQVRGREKSHLLRQALYRLNGRQKAVWLPSFNEDMTLTRPVLSGDTSVFVRKFGYTLLGGPISGRNRAMIRDENDDPFPLEITASAEVGTDEEELTLSAAVTFNAPEGRAFCFMETVRLDQDEVEITHYADNEGSREVSVAMRSFIDARTAPSILVVPATVGSMQAGPCGDMTYAACAPTFETYDGWDYECRVIGEYPGEPPIDWFLYLHNPPSYGQIGGSAGSDWAEVHDLVVGNTKQLLRRVSFDPVADAAYDATQDVWYAGVDCYHAIGVSNWISTHWKIYFRHWTQPWPGDSGILFYDQIGGTPPGPVNGEHFIEVTTSIDWRDYR